MTTVNMTAATTDNLIFTNNSDSYMAGYKDYISDLFENEAVPTFDEYLNTVITNRWNELLEEFINAGCNNACIVTGTLNFRTDTHDMLPFRENSVIDGINWCCNDADMINIYFIDGIIYIVNINSKRINTFRIYLFNDEFPYDEDRDDLGHKYYYKYFPENLF